MASTIYDKVYVDEDWSSADDMHGFLKHPLQHAHQSKPILVPHIKTYLRSMVKPSFRVVVGP